MGLRIISGAIRRGPIQEMEKVADLQSLECHSMGKAEETDQSSTPPETTA